MRVLGALCADVPYDFGVEGFFPVYLANELGKMLVLEIFGLASEKFEDPAFEAWGFLARECL